jgi:hypothetical protein
MADAPQFLISQQQVMIPKEDYSPSRTLYNATTNSSRSEDAQRRIRTITRLTNNNNTSSKIPLVELIHTDPKCVEPGIGRSRLQIVESIHLDDESLTHPPNRKIPKIIHMTAKTRCMPKAFSDNVQKWQHFANHSFYLHDEEAVDRLLQKYWPEFPHLQLVQQCMISGAAKADLWRYLVLWEYGGIYADIDSAPGPKFVDPNGTVVIDDSEDAWFVVERIGVMSQYFMAASPKHPYLYLCVMHCLSRLLEEKNVGNQYVPVVTGPGTTKSAMIYFMQSQNNEAAYQTVKAGTYAGIGNRTLRVRGSKRKTDLWIRRNALDVRTKAEGYAAMGMTHFSQSKNPLLFNVSCYEHLYNEEYKRTVRRARLG